MEFKIRPLFLFFILQKVGGDHGRGGGRQGGGGGQQGCEGGQQEVVEGVQWFFFKFYKVKL